MSKLNLLKESLKTRKGPVKPEVQKGIDAILRANKYRYNVWIDKTLMQDYIHLCRRRSTTATKEIAKYIDRELKKHDELVE
jgi:hypothetical protein